MSTSQSIVSRAGKVASKAIRKSLNVTVPLEFGTEHGHQIFVYTHLLTRRVVYSLQRSMRVF